MTRKLYGVWGPPTVYAVDRGGQFVARAVGAQDWNIPAARAFILALLVAR